MLAAVDNDDGLLGISFFLAVLIALQVYRFFSRSRRRDRRVVNAATAGNVTPIHPTIATPPPARFDMDAPAVRNQPIEHIRQLLGPTPRTFSKQIEAYLAVKPPPWMAATDALHSIYKKQKKIRRDGQVVWAVFVQAHQLSFHPGPTDVGGSMIYSLDPYYDENPGELQAMAAEVFALKGTDQADADAATFARMLTLESSRGMGLPVPRRFTGGHKVLHSSMIFPRKHLPNGFLTANILPVWVDPTGQPGLLPVPAAYWPASLLAFWSRVAPANAPTPAQPKPADE